MLDRCATPDRPHAAQEGWCDATLSTMKQASSLENLSLMVLFGGSLHNRVCRASDLGTFPQSHLDEAGLLSRPAPPLLVREPAGKGVCRKMHRAGSPGARPQAPAPSSCSQRLGSEAAACICPAWVARARPLRKDPEPSGCRNGNTGPQGPSENKGGTPSDRAGPGAEVARQLR